MCECYVIGGPFIGADPECPAHGDEATRRADRIDELEQRIAALEERILELEALLGTSRQ
jgi:uncharacterized small protein (DUF1192 family)